MATCAVKMATCYFWNAPSRASNSNSLLTKDPALTHIGKARLSGISNCRSLKMHWHVRDFLRGLFSLRRQTTVKRSPPRSLSSHASRHYSSTEAAEIHSTVRLLFDRVPGSFERDDDFVARDFDLAWRARAARRGDFVWRAAAAGMSPPPFAPATMACSASEGIPSRLSCFLRSIIC